MYILFSLNKKPKSGYQILKDIEEKTQGKWAPSKGTIYPIISQMLKDELIKVKTFEPRAKKVLELTKKGKKTLLQIHKQKDKKREDLIKFRSLLAQIFGNNIAYFGEYLMDIKETALSVKNSKKQQALKILKKCISDLKKL